MDFSCIDSVNLVYELEDGTQQQALAFTCTHNVTFRYLQYTENNIIIKRLVQYDSMHLTTCPEAQAQNFTR
jgi:hypothetical protein